MYAPYPLPRPLTSPVRAWIYGGLNTIGNAADYDGCRTAAAMQSVVVTFNYRLGALGFLVTSGLVKEGGTGNYAMTDQRMALSWVQRNVEAFGGDPRRVLLFGESAGGLNTMINYLSPGASGLFAAVMIESGGIRDVPTVAQAVDRFAASV